MKIEVAVAELKGVRVAIAFPPPAWVAPGVGDALLARLPPWFPALPLMLAARQGAQRGSGDRTGGKWRVHAAFQAGALAAGCDLAAFERRTIDLDLPPPRPDRPSPF